MAPDLDPPSTGQVNRKLTQPLSYAVSAVLIIAVSLLVTALGSVLSTSNFSFMGLGSGAACATVPLSGLAQPGTTSTLAHMRPGTFAGAAGQLLLCANRPGIGQRALVVLTEAPTAALYLTILLLLWQLLRTIRATGPFALPVARRMRFLAWFILAGSLVIAAAQAAAQCVFASTIVTGPVPVASNMISAVNPLTNGPLVAVLAGCGLLTLARVIRAGTQMSDDLVGTV